jgi:hypothetical protein
MSATRDSLERFRRRAPVHPGEKFGRRVFTTPDGKALFVPTEDQWLVHAAGCGGISIKALARAAVRPDEYHDARRRKLARHVNAATICEWRAAYQDHEWFDGWQLYGAQAPRSVTIVTPEQLARCRKAWDWMGFCLRAGLHPQDFYHGLFKASVLADPGWRKWLFGWPPSAGVFVVNGKLLRLREETSQRGVCKAAGTTAAAVKYWRAHPHLKAALEDVIRHASRPRTTVKPGGPSWRQQHPRVGAAVIARMLNYAKALSLQDCCRRAWRKAQAEANALTGGRGRTGRPRERADDGQAPLSEYYRLLAEAEAVGAKSRLEQFLKFEGAFRWEESKRCGLLASNFFVPSPGMLKFRSLARAASAEQRIYELESLPAFEEWFLHWTTPRVEVGRSRPGQESEGERVDAVGRAWRGHPRHAAISGPHAVRIEEPSRPEAASLEAMAEEATAPDPGTPGGVPQQRPGKRGRPPSKQTQAIGKRAWELYFRDGKKLASVRARLAEEFQRGAPTDLSHIRTYALRYAKRHGKSVKRKTQQNA